MNNSSQYISVDKETAAGAPVFKGTRVAVKTLFDYLEESSLEDFLKGFPSVSREQAEAVIEIAAVKLLADLAA
ncbi:MAG: DUF433 domain-containing protein [Bacteroidota bacterium]|nr:DUF433 domain-containing protein [Bacteroidota bacterium]